MKSFGLILVALATSAVAHPFQYKGFSKRQAVACETTADCGATEFCAGSVCETFDDCRGTVGSCPGGVCAPTDEAVGDERDPTRQFQCLFDTAEPSPSAPASSASAEPSSSAPGSSASAEPSQSASASVSVSAAPSPSASLAPGTCRGSNADCAATEYCEPTGSEFDVCVQLRDCRGTIDGCAGGFCVPENATSTGDAQDPSRPYICSFEPAPSASASSSVSVSASASASVSSASGSASASVSISPSPSSSPAPSSAAPTVPPSSEAPKPTEAPHPPPKGDDHPAPPKGDDHPAPPKEDEHKDDGKNDSAWRDEYKDSHQGDGSDSGKTCDQSFIESLLWEIKGELKGLKWEVEQLKKAAEKH